MQRLQVLIGILGGLVGLSLIFFALAWAGASDLLVIFSSLLAAMLAGIGIDCWLKRRR